MKMLAPAVSTALTQTAKAIALSMGSQATAVSSVEFDQVYSALPHAEPAELAVAVDAIQAPLEQVDEEHDLQAPLTIADRARFNDLAVKEALGTISDGEQRELQILDRRRRQPRADNEVNERLSLQRYDARLKKLIRMHHEFDRSRIAKSQTRQSPKGPQKK